MTEAVVMYLPHTPALFVHAGFCLHLMNAPYFLSFCFISSLLPLLFVKVLITVHLPFSHLQDHFCDKLTQFLKINFVFEFGTEQLTGKIAG